MIRIYKDFHFDAAHWLPRVPEGHKCRCLHGHTYHVRVWCSGPLDERGFVVDYAEIGNEALRLLNEVDHRCLNELPGLENPTTERLAQWFWDRLKPALPRLCSVEVRESDSTGCICEH